MDDKMDAREQGFDAGMSEVEIATMAEMSDEELEGIVGGIDVHGIAQRADGSCACSYCGMKFSSRQQVLSHIMKVHLHK